MRNFLASSEEFFLGRLERFLPFPLSVEDSAGLFAEPPKRKANGKEGTWQTGYDVFRWWLEEDFNQYEIGEEFYQNEE